MQSTLHSERVLRQQRENIAAQFEAEKLHLQTNFVDLEAKLRVAEKRASEAEEEQLKAEQQLLVVSADLTSAQQAPAASATTQQQQQLAEMHQQLHASQSRAGELQAKLASAESQLAVSQQQLADRRSLPSEIISRAYVQVVDSSQLKGHSSGSLPDAQLDASQPEQRLRSQVTSLKASRDKLLSEVDSQSREIERLLTENSTLEQSLSQSRDSAADWEKQAQESLQVMNQLKGMLEESASWQSQAPSQNDVSNSGEPQNDTALQTEVLQGKARAAGLEVQVKALCLELASARQYAGALSQSTASNLGTIGSRLAQLLGGTAQQGVT